MYKIEEILYKGESKFQDVKIAILEGFGKALILDNVVQFTEKEEFIYHETLAHIPMFTHPNPQNVLIIGGGDGGIAREVLRHQSVKKVFLVDLDEKVTDITREYFPSFRTIFDDKRLTTLYTDGLQFVKESKDKFDVVLIDLTDPVGPAKPLFEEPFYRLVSNVLSDDGIMCCQSESLWYHNNIIKDIQNSLLKIFPVVDLFTLVTPVYTGYWWGLSYASKSLDPRKSHRTCDVKTKYYQDDVRAYSFFPESLLKKLREGNLNY